MILLVDRELVINTAVKGEFEGKKTPLYMYVTVNESNIVPSLDTLTPSKGVVAFNYVGGLDFLLANEGTIKAYNKPVTVSLKLETFETLDSLREVLLKIPSFIRVVIQLPESFTNMKFVYEESRKYPNVHFEGGKLIRLEGCRIGAITETDIPRKIADSRIDLTPSSNNSSVMRYVSLDELDSYEFFEYRDTTKKLRTSKPKAPKSTRDKAESKPKVVKPTKPSAKSSVSSLFGAPKINKSNGFNNF